MSGITLLQIEDLHMSFGETQLLKGMNLEVQRGEILGLVGPNGSGKSTLLNIISGIIVPQHGNITLDKSPQNGLRVKVFLPF